MPHFCTSTPPTRQHNFVSRKAIVIAAASTVVEWYDFTLYIYFATVISRTFFGHTTNAILTTLGVFGVSYLMRPLGAAFFGHLGDRIGRKPVLLASMTLMSAAMAATALLPTYDRVGIASGIALTALRFLMAFSVGGEYNAVIAYLIEGAHPHRRGTIASLAAAASEVGALLSVAVSALTVTFTSDTQLAAWGWRIPFAIGAFLALLTLFARSTLQETPEYRPTIHSTKEEKPTRPLLYTLRTYPRPILRTFAISALASVSYYVTVTYLPTYLVTQHLLTEESSLWVSTAAAFLLIVITPFMGMLSDHIGRKPILIVTALGTTLLPLFLFWLMGEGLGGLIVGAISLALITGCYNAVSGTATAEQFPAVGRLSGLALGVTVATAVFGGLTPLISEKLIHITGCAIIPGALVAVVSLCVMPILWRLPETAPRLTEDHKDS